MTDLLKPFFKNKDRDIENKKDETVQKFINVKDIRDKFLYTRDGYIISYIQVPSIDINLLSETEKKSKARILTAEFSSETKEFKFLAVSKPADIQPLLNDYQTIYINTSNIIQKELLRHEMVSITNFALSGEVVERQFYFMIWESYEEGIEMDIIKRAMEFVSRFESAGLKPSVLSENKIIRLCNLINNPAFVNIEDISFESTMPFIFQYGETIN